jgi:mannose-6-phosphate isomerase-like protein (cupin superfamily)
LAVRRVVTGHDDDGRSVIVEDAAVEPITTALVPGYAAHEVWKADGAATLPAPAPPSGTRTYYPPVDGVRFQVLTIPPAGPAAPDGVDLDAELARLDRTAPGILAVNEVDDPGMHTTDSVDYVYVASGDVWLEVDDGAEVELHAGDTVVQQGVRHAWRNRSGRPVVLVGTLVGARRT